jgi:hypothetical protein
MKTSQRKRRTALDRFNNFLWQRVPVLVPNVARRRSSLTRRPFSYEVEEFIALAGSEAEYRQRIADMRAVVEAIDDECRERWPQMLERLVNLGDSVDEVVEFAEEFGVEEEVFPDRILQLRDELRSTWGKKPDPAALIAWDAMPEMNPGRGRWRALENLKPIGIAPPFARHFSGELALAVQAHWRKCKECSNCKRKFVARRVEDKYCPMEGCRKYRNAQKSRRSYGRNKADISRRRQVKRELISPVKNAFDEDRGPRSRISGSGQQESHVSVRSTGSPFTEVNGCNSS